MPGVEPGAVLPKVAKGDFKESDGPSAGHGPEAPKGGGCRCQAIALIFPSETDTDERVPAAR